MSSWLRPRGELFPETKGRIQGKSAHEHFVAAPRMLSIALHDAALVVMLLDRGGHGALVGFAGCVVVISHDRWFLNRIATHMLAFEGDSEVVWFQGNYADYEADLKRRKGVDADQPHRIRFKPLMR